MGGAVVACQEASELYPDEKDASASFVIAFVIAKARALRWLVLRYDEATRAWSVSAIAVSLLAMHNIWFVSDYPIREDKDARVIHDVREGQLLEIASGSTRTPW